MWPCPTREAPDRKGACGRPHASSVTPAWASWHGGLPCPGPWRDTPGAPPSQPPSCLFGSRGGSPEYPVKPRPHWGRGVCACWGPSPGHSAHRPSGRRRPGRHGAGHWEPLFIPGVHRSCSPLRAVGHPVCGLCTQELTEGSPLQTSLVAPLRGLGVLGEVPLHSDVPGTFPGDQRARAVQP